MDNEQDDPDTIKILVTTDNHVGYMEKDPIRERDGLEALEEVFQQAHIHDVDMILLGGDLFHENTPSRSSIHGVMKIMRRYCLGDRPCTLELLSDPTDNVEMSFPTLNYEDGNFNIAYPVFSIHGNHDDVAGVGNLSALNVLEIAGLVNYFGRVYDPENITISPLLFRKGNTKLALYGLSNVRDRRLYRSFVQKQVRVNAPAQDPDTWFNLFTIHQNRAAHAPKDYIPENFLADFLDVVIWGHEHECILEPSRNLEQDFDVIQPGSTIATSCIAAEAKPKHCLVLKVNGRQYSHEWIRLKNVRPFVHDDLVLKDIKGLEPDATEDITEKLMEKVEDMIMQAKDEWKDLHAATPEKLKKMPLPIIRLRVETSGGYTIENPQRFGQRFVDKIANPSELLQIMKQKASSRGKRAVVDEVEVAGRARGPDRLKVKTLVEQYLSAQNLHILDENRMDQALRQFLEKDDKEAITDNFEGSLDILQKHLMTGQGDDDEAIDDEMGNYKDTGDKEQPTLRKSSSRRQVQDSDDDDNGMLLDSDDASAIASSSRRSKTAAHSTAKPKAASKKANTISLDSDDDDFDLPAVVDEMVVDSDNESQPRSRKTTGRKTTAKPKAPAKKAPARSKATPAASKGRQMPLQFSQEPAPARSSTRRAATKKAPVIDDDDDFEDM